MFDNAPLLAVPPAGARGLDRRVRRTRRSLQAALVALTLEKGYDAVTVQDLLDRADVGRATFYAHFRDKDDLLLSGFDGLWAELRQRVAGQRPEEVAEFLFAHAGQHRAEWRALVGRRGGDLLRRHFHRELRAVLSEHLAPACGVNWPPVQRPDVPLEIAAEYLVSALLSLLVWWLDSGQRYSAEEMGATFIRLAHPTLEALLHLPARR